MKNPAYPGASIKDDLAELGLSTAEAAKGLGVTRQQLHNVITGRSAITPDMALRLEIGIGGSADHWMRMQAAYDLAQARLRIGKLTVKRLAPRAA
jgi:addiction module HigA family antidote